MNLHQITFSPTGGTLSVCESICKGRGIGKVMHFIIAQMIKKPCASRKSNEIYL